MKIITPDEARSSKNNEIQSYIEQLSIKLNQQLSNRMSACVSLQGIPNDLKDKVYARIGQLFRQVGWHVERSKYSDFRETWDNIQVYE